MDAQNSKADSELDYRVRLYEHYATEQMAIDLPSLRTSFSRGFPYYRQLIERHMPVNRTARILDLGSGYGPLIHELQLAGYSNIRGVDASPEQVQIARALGLQCIYEAEIMSELSRIPDQSCDAISAIDVIEHFTKREILALLDSARRVLKPNGVLILHVPNGEAIFSGKIFFGDYTHQTAFTRKSLRQVVLASGFSSIACYEDKPIAHGAVSAFRAILWQFVRSGYRLINAIETGEPGSDLILSQNLLAICRKGVKQTGTLTNLYQES